MSRYSKEQLRAIHAKNYYSKTGDIINSLKMKHGDKNLEVDDIWRKPEYAEHLVRNGDVISRYTFDNDFKIKTPINMYKTVAKHSRSYVDTDLPYVQKYLYKGRGEFIEMTPDDFLRLASPISNNRYDENAYNIESLNFLKNNIGNNAIETPQLDVVKNNGVFQINSHEGRHRAFIAKQKGIPKIPVFISTYESQPRFTKDDLEKIHRLEFIPESH